MILRTKGGTRAAEEILREEPTDRPLARQSDAKFEVLRPSLAGFRIRPRLFDSKVAKGGSRVGILSSALRDSGAKAPELGCLHRSPGFSCLVLEDGGEKVPSPPAY